MTYTIEQLLQRHDDWDTERGKLHERDGSGEHPVSSSEWQGSDDEGSELATLLADALRRPIKVWTLTVHDPNHRSTTVHATEEQCWESLRVNYDPEDDYALESPVEIVDTLERRQGLTIDIDVHEIARP